MQNPLTEKEYETKQEYVESLAESYRKLAKQKYQQAQQEAELIKAIDEAAGQGDVVKGKITLAGMKHDIVLTRKVNVSYPRPRGAEHPLRQLLGDFEELAPLISVDYKERGTQVEKLLVKMRVGEISDEIMLQLAQALAKVRQEKPGKPGIEVKEK